MDKNIGQGSPGSGIGALISKRHCCFNTGLGIPVNGLDPGLVDHTGIRPEIARALTSLNIDLSSVTTRSKLSEGLKEAFRQLHIEVSRPGK